MPAPQSHKRFALHAGFVSLIALGTLTGCQTQDDAGQTHSAEANDAGVLEDKYSVLSTLEHSILREYDKAANTQGSHIRYPVCVSAEFWIDQTTRERWLALEQRAVTRWNDALRGADGWRVDSIQLYLVGGEAPSSCPTTDRGMRVYKLVGLANQDRGYAEFYSFKNAIGRAEFGREDLGRELHEYGHQLGMGDTYVEQGYQVPIGQPQGVMNLYFEVNDLTEDDIAGIRHIWWMIRNDSREPCADGYGPGQTRQNNNGHRFCVKLNGQPPATDPGSGCGDNNGHCGAWAARGECQANPDYMLTNCCASCNAGGGGGSGGTTGSQCTDSNANCASWAARGECQANPDYMRTNCCASCNAGGGGGTTGSQCTDSNANCASWAARGECQANPEYMLTNCCGSCNAGGGGGGGTTGSSCTDKNANCASWAARGECDANPGYMLTSCCASCR